MARQLIHHGTVRYYRHGDEFWLDLIARWKVSGIGVRKFCEQNGVATCTFHKRRADLEKCASIPVVANVMRPDACFIPVLPDAMPAKPASRDSVIISSGGMRIELTGAHADRVVRQLLGRLGGFSCWSPEPVAPTYVVTWSTCAMESMACPIWLSHCWRSIRCPATYLSSLDVIGARSKFCIGIALDSRSGTSDLSVVASRHPSR